MKKTIVSLLLVFSIILSFSSSFSVTGTSYEDPTEDYEPIIAEHEDTSINIWFEHPYNKVQPTNITSNGNDSYIINMAKNEIEGAQFILYSAQAKTGLTAEISDFEDESGNILVPEIFYEYYSQSFSGLTPDAIPPLVDSFNLTAGKSKAFYYKVTTKQDTIEGLYTATLIIRDNNGNEIKKANIFLRVWNVVLSEETACKTALWLNYSPIESRHQAAGSTLTGKELYKIYYDYLLENRICAFSMPSSVLERNNDAAVYMDNPRVTSFVVGGHSYPTTVSLTDDEISFAYRKLKDNPEWLKKAYFFPAGEPVVSQDVDDFIARSSHIKSLFPEANLLLPLEYTYQYDNDMDIIEKLKGSVDIWVPRYNSFTDRGLDVSGSRYETTAEQDNKYGSYKSRMEEEMQSGNSVWWYPYAELKAPYAQVTLDTNLISTRILFWQQKMYDVDGFLYFSLNKWFEQNYWDSCPYIAPNGVTVLGYGNGLLLYDGAKVGLDGPVGSLRLEAMRDGIEDFQLLAMHQGRYGETATDNLISSVSQHIAQYNSDGDNFLTTKIALLESLETVSCADGEHQGGQATCLSKAICEICGSTYGELGDHTYQVQNINYITQADCINDGTAEVECEVCNENISLSIPALNHNLNDKNQCTRDNCNYVEFFVGDLNYDGFIDDQDDMLMTRYLAMWEVDINEFAADIILDGLIDDIDAMMLSRYLANWGLSSRIGDYTNNFIGIPL